MYIRNRLINTDIIHTLLGHVVLRIGLADQPDFSTGQYGKVSDIIIIYGASYKEVSLGGRLFG